MVDARTKWTDGEISSYCGNILYKYQDYAKYYAFAYVDIDFTDFIKRGIYKEIGETAQNVSSFVCLGNHNMCICLMNSQSYEVVRQISINYFMLKSVDIEEKRLETIINISLDNNYITIKIPSNVSGLDLQYQKSMRENIAEFFYNIDRIEK